jgi:tetratricopeptide (TPR) repeat protein
MLYRRRTILWVIGCTLTLILAIGIGWFQTHPRLQLPSAARYEKLPEIFNRTLQSRRDQVNLSRDDPDEVRKLANLYQANRLYREARACYSIIAKSPGGLTAHDHYYLADLDQNENDLAGAQIELRAVLKAEPNYIPARLILADALFKSGREDEAAKEYTAVLAIEPNQSQASFGLARVELQRGDDDAAAAQLEELMAAHPESTSGAGLFAQILGRRGDTDRAIAMTQMSSQKPEPPVADPWMAALLADCYDVQRLSLTFEEYFKTGKMDEAVPLLDRLTELDPKGPIPMIFSGFSHARALQHITAIREYYAALGKGGDPEKICPPLVQSLLALGKGSEAAGLMAESYARMPDSLPITKAYAEVAVQRGDDKLAKGLLIKVLQKEPFLHSENMSLAKIFWSSGERDEAAHCLQRIATVYANDVPSRALLGEYYLGKSEPLAAIKPLEQAMTYVPAKTPAQESLTGMLVTAYLQVGNSDAEKERFAEAESYFEKAIRLAPANLTAYAGKANACVQVKQFRGAADALEKMSSLDPGNPTIYLSLGDVIYQDGDASRAQQQWQKARQLVAAADTDLRDAIDLRLSGHITVDTFK